MLVAALLTLSLLGGPIAAQATVAVAPTLTVTGQTVSWQSIAGAENYVLATVRNPTTSRATNYRRIDCCSVTPPAVPGETVNYGLRTDIAGSSWAKEVSITYPQAAKPSRLIKGIDTNVTGWGPQGSSVLTAMSGLGVNWIREDLSWQAHEPSRGVFDWSDFDNTVTEAHAAGFHILPILGYAPSWSSPDKATDFAAFAAAAVRRYGPGTKANITYFEIWNEPYFASGWGKTPNAGQYAHDFVAAAAAGRAANSAARFLIAADVADAPKTGGSCPWDVCWIQDMFTAEPKLPHYIDGISSHPYSQDSPAYPLAADSTFRSSTGNWAFARIDTARSLFAKRGVTSPFWITEIGWPTCPANSRCVNEKTQATYFRQLFGLIAARPWVHALFPYAGWECCHTDTADPEQYFGLQRWPDRSHKPAWNVVKAGFATR